MVRVPPRWLLGAPLAATHSDPAAIAAPAGALVTSIRLTVELVRASMRETVASYSFVTHTLLPSTASPFGPAPTGTAATTASAEGSMRERVPSNVLTTHT